MSRFYVYWGRFRISVKSGHKGMVEQKYVL
jgi:hypothetical protein